MNRYCLIVSQYRHSYHTFFVKVPTDIATFKSCLLGVVEELEKYKRDETDTREINYGDLMYLLDDSKEIFYRYNINDSGDIYIINNAFINNLKDDASYYKLEQYKASRGYKRKDVIEDISKHHNYDKIYTIIKKYFEIG